MEKESSLNLNDIGELLYRITQRYLYRKNTDTGVDITIQADSLQETMTLRLPDDSRLLVKTFPHKNFAQQLVYRIEVYKTRLGDMRGNKVAFMEALPVDSSIDEIHRFVQSFLSQLGY